MIITMNIVVPKSCSCGLSHKGVLTGEENEDGFWFNCSCKSSLLILKSDYNHHRGEGYELKESVFRELDQEFAGYCSHCDDQTNWGVEPDAEGYRCDECGKNKVMGMAQGLIMGFIKIV